MCRMNCDIYRIRQNLTELITQLRKNICIRVLLIINYKYEKGSVTASNKFIILTIVFTSSFFFTKKSFDCKSKARNLVISR